MALQHSKIHTEMQVEEQAMEAVQIHSVTSTLETSLMIFLVDQDLVHLVDLVVEVNHHQKLVKEAIHFME